MKILTKYLGKNFFRLFFILLSTFISLYLIIDFLQKIDNFMEAHAANRDMFMYFAYKIPYISIQMTPVATLLSVILMFCSMKKHNEILALKASGLSVVRISFPVICASLLLTIAVFFVSELIVPYTSTRSQNIWISEVKKNRHKRLYGRSHIWYKGRDSIYWIRYFDDKKMIMHGPVFYFFDKSFHLIKRIQAKKAVWSDKEWILHQATVQTLMPSGNYDMKTFAKMTIDIPETPKSFLRPAIRPEEMSYWQLKKFADSIQSEGYSATRYLVDMNIKLAFPVVCLIMTLIGVPLALGINKGGAPLSVTIGIAASFIYLIILGSSRALGIMGIIPVWLSAWMANILFFLLGIYMIIHLDT